MRKFQRLSMHIVLVALVVATSFWIPTARAASLRERIIVGPPQCVEQSCPTQQLCCGKYLKYRSYLKHPIYHRLLHKPSSQCAVSGAQD